jgi:hypothetical protein
MVDGKKGWRVKRTRVERTRSSEVPRVRHELSNLAVAFCRAVVFGRDQKFPSILQK